MNIETENNRIESNKQPFSSKPSYDKPSYDKTLQIEDLGTFTTDGSVGFSLVPDNIRERSIKEGFELNTLVVGRRGLGSSTLINSLFGAPLISKTRENGLTVEKNEIIENEISLETTTITYHQDDIGPLVEYIDTLFMDYFESEQGTYKLHKDNRIHLCLYLFPSDNITQVELNNLKILSNKCNTVPIIPKADMYTPEELQSRKEYVRRVLLENEIDCFVPSMDDGEEAMNMPYGIIASETAYEYEGEVIRGRKYPWGFINIENEKTNDFKRLQNLIICTHLDELISRTDVIFYNSFRQRILEIERNSEAIQMNRYNRLKGEMENILREKYMAKIENLKREEDDLDMAYQRMNDLNIEGSKVE